MQDIVFRIPDTWRRAASLYGNSLYACRNIQTILSDDVNCIEKLFSDLEQTSSEMEDDELDILSVCILSMLFCHRVFTASRHAISRTIYFILQHLHLLSWILMM